MSDLRSCTVEILLHKNIDKQELKPSNFLNVFAIIITVIAPETCMIDTVKAKKLFSELNLKI